MATPLVPLPILSWKHAYSTAILEKDPQLIIGAVQQAEVAFTYREHELFGKPEAFDELQEIVPTRSMLEALCSCLRYREDT